MSAASPLIKYLESNKTEQLDAGFVAYLASLSKVAEVSPEVAAGIVAELRDQRRNLKLIASENFSSLSSQLAMGNLLTDKYAEGFPHRRFYAGCENVDNIEAYCADQAKELFGAEHAYVQPHSGADANLIAYWAILHERVGNKHLAELGDKKINDLTRDEWNDFRAKLGNQRLLGLDYYSGGHLTHGYRFNVSAQMFECFSYAVDKETGLLDYDEIEKQALEIKPLIFLTGYSAYPREINFKRMREIADKVGAVFMVDMAHFSGLVAGKVFTGDSNPIEHAHVVTTTTHKTLRGPRGGLILCKKEFAEQVDKGCPLVIGGPLPHVMGAKAVAFKEANDASFNDYSQKVVDNSRALAAACIDEGMEVLTGGTDNHLLLIDVRGFGLNGRQAETVLRECGVTLNRNSIPFDPNGAWFTSGLRLGTPAITTLGMEPEQMKEIAAVIKLVLSNSKPSILKKGVNAGKPSKSKAKVDASAKTEATSRIKTLLDEYPLYPELDLKFLEANFLK